MTIFPLAHTQIGVTNRSIIRLGGFSLAGGALAFMGVFTYLASAFNYPAVLDGDAAEVLPKLLATGTTGRAVWALYAFLPLIWLPAAAGAQEALGKRTRDSSLVSQSGHRNTGEADGAPVDVQSGAMRLATLFAGLASIAMMLGLMRWPTIHWELARAHAIAGADERVVIAAIFDGLNTYLGNYLGEFLGELGFSCFFLLTGIAWLQSRAGARWIGWLGVLTAVVGLTGMFRNLTTAVAAIAAVNNYLLPLCMIVLGIALARLKPVVTTIPR